MGRKPFIYVEKSSYFQRKSNYFYSKKGRKTIWHIDKRSITATNVENISILILFADNKNTKGHAALSA